MATPTALPAAFVAGDVLLAEQLNDVRGAFRVLQVVTGTTTTSTSSSTATMADTTLTATITPSDSSSNVLVFANHPGCKKAAGNVNNALLLKLFRGATLLAFNNSIGADGTTAELIFSTSFVYLDSPATTSATTYKTQFSNAVVAASVSVQLASTPSNIILMEISA